MASSHLSPKPYTSQLLQTRALIACLSLIICLLQLVSAGSDLPIVTEPLTVLTDRQTLRLPAEHHQRLYHTHHNGERQPHDTLHRVNNKYYVNSTQQLTTKYTESRFHVDATTTASSSSLLVGCAGLDFFVDVTIGDPSNTNSQTFSTLR